MKHSLLNASVKASLFKDRLINTLRSTFNGEEDGDIVQTVIIIAAFVIICVFVGGLLYAAISQQAVKTSNCIASVNQTSCTQFHR
jgi:hypothetical protein